MRALLFYGVGLCLASPVYARAAGSFVVSDGLNRAPAMVLHCVQPNNSAGPCGTAAQPLIVSPSGPMANSTNQTTQIQAEQATAAALGTQQDISATSGTASIVALLKGANSTLAAGVGANPVGGTLLSRSLSIPAQTSVSLFPANPNRHYLAFQAPAGTSIWVNLVGGTASPNGADCAQFAAGAFYESGQFVNRGAITVFSPVAVSMSAWEG